MVRGVVPNGVVPADMACYRPRGPAIKKAPVGRVPFARMLHGRWNHPGAGSGPPRRTSGSASSVPGRDDRARGGCSFSSRSLTVGLVRLSPRMMRSMSLLSSVSYLISALATASTRSRLASSSWRVSLVERVDQLLDFLVDRSWRSPRSIPAAAEAEHVGLVLVFAVEDEAEAIVHAPVADHLAGDAGGLADVADGAGVDVAGEHLLGDAAAEAASSWYAMHHLRRVVVCGPSPAGHGRAAEAAARDDRHLVDRVGVLASRYCTTAWPAS